MTTDPKMVPAYQGDDPTPEPEECPSCKSRTRTSRNGWLDLSGAGFHWCKHQWHDQED